jgi:hypothetical protein
MLVCKTKHMKFCTLTFWALLSFLPLAAQPTSQAPNVFIITIDGLRWQEVFNGADQRIIANNKYVQDSSLTADMFGGSSAQERREKLMPFFWRTIANRGQLHGNRRYNNKMNVSNLYNISYPGYNEIITGYADPFIASNKPVANTNTNLLQFLQQQPAYKNEVVAFSSWDVFPAILNEAATGIPVNSGFENMEVSNNNIELINRVQDGIINKTGTRHDQLTFLNAKEYLQQKHPKVMMLGFGETDEFGHQKKYDQYLQHIYEVDQMIASLWYYLQTDPFYKNNSIVVITTDHGRGNKPTTWHSHSMLRGGSSETWMALLGRGIAPMGEITSPAQFYQKQIAATIANLMQQKFTASHRIASAIILAQTDNALHNPAVTPLHFENNAIAGGVDAVTAAYLLLALMMLGYTKKVVRK